MPYKCNNNRPHFQFPLVLTGVEAGIFSTLSSEPRIFTSVELSQKSGVDVGLLSKLLASKP